jgi:hypothetical protein
VWSDESFREETGYKHDGGTSAKITTAPMIAAELRALADDIEQFEADES